MFVLAVGGALQGPPRRAAVGPKARHVLAESATEETFAEIARAGLNIVRVPFGYWVLGDTDLCPHVPSIQYLDLAVKWATAHSLQVILDLHGLPVTQNGMDHSGTSTHPPYADAWARAPLDGKDWLRAALAAPFDGVTVAVTHFAPSLRSADPRYGLTPGTAGFCNALDALLPLADVWMHGHLHCINDYLVEGVLDQRPWRCRVVANPLGYLSKGEQAAFRENLVIELPG